jgi:hypothetical protein
MTYSQQKNFTTNKWMISLAARLFIGQPDKLEDFASPLWWQGAGL